MELGAGVVLGVVLAASIAAAYRLLRMPRPVLSPGGEAMRAALHAASATLPHLRKGLTAETAGRSAPHLLALTQAEAVAIADHERILACEGIDGEPVNPRDPVPEWVTRARGDRVHVEPELGDAGMGAGLVAPLVVQDEQIGYLIVYYADRGAITPEDTRVVRETAALVSAQIELSTVEAQGERLARAELRALRAQISPHFIYNALAAVASHIHTRPEEARELLTEFAEFTRYAFRGERPYVSLADELHYVEKYLRLEQARFGDRLEVRVAVDPEVLTAVVPVLSLQPLVENAVRHGVEPLATGVRLEILGRDLGRDVELTVSDDGAGMPVERVRDVLKGMGGRGIGLFNVHSRLEQTFGSGYGLQVESEPGRGTRVTMTVPKFRAGVRAA